jgi:hypothetical protein
MHSMSPSGMIEFPLLSQCCMCVVTFALNRYLDFWHKLLFNDNRVIGGNKLRTYRKIKTDFKREQYLYADVD